MIQKFGHYLSSVKNGVKIGLWRLLVSYFKLLAVYKNTMDKRVRILKRLVEVYNCQESSWEQTEQVNETSRPPIF